jgi:hypothetical protein
MKYANADFYIQALAVLGATSELTSKASCMKPSTANARVATWFSAAPAILLSTLRSVMRLLIADDSGSVPTSHPMRPASHCGSV